MSNMAVGSTALFKIDDTDNPGLARVKLLKEITKNPLPWKVWSAEVLEIVKPSTAPKSMQSTVKIGMRKEIGETKLIAE